MTVTFAACARRSRSRCSCTAQAVTRHFPEGTRISRPAGGYILWLELPKRVDSLKLYRAAAAQKISIVPGVIFSPTGRFRHHIRISCGHPLDETIERALIHPRQIMR